MGKEISEVKKALRAQMREALADLSEEERAESDRVLLERFLAHPKLAQAQTVLLYYGVGTEIHTAPLIDALLAQGKTVCLPRCLPGHKMQAHRITGEADLVPDKYQIPAPRPDAPEVAREDIDLILVPGLCFAGPPPWGWRARKSPDSWCGAFAYTPASRAWARAAAITTAIWRTTRARPSACAARTSSRSTCRASRWTSGCRRS